MMEQRAPACLGEYEKLQIRMSTPRVVIDNGGCSDATRLMIERAGKDGFLLLEAVQVLTDLNLSIKKAYISSDGRWFMDVFHVTDFNGHKLTDDAILGSIEQSLVAVHYGGVKNTAVGLTALELTGSDRVGLLSEVFAVLFDHKCNIVDAKVWTHNGRVASLIYVTHEAYGSPVEHTEKMSAVEAMLRNILHGDNTDIATVKTCVSLDVMNTDRRLHQLMFDDKDFNRKPIIKVFDDNLLVVSVKNYLEKDYSVVNIHCKDRNKLLFDIVCTLTDMKYVVFHATVNTSQDRAHLEFFIRHMDGSPIHSETEKQRVIICLQAAIKRRASQGLRLEMITPDRKGLLAEVMRIFRENSLNVTMAEVSTSKGTAHNTFYITDSHGNIPDSAVVESVRQRVGSSSLNVKEAPLIVSKKEDESEVSGGAMLWSFGSIVRRNLFKLVKSCS